MQRVQRYLALALVALSLPAVTAQQRRPQDQSDSQSFRFRSAVELINVTATVTDDQGRFVPGLRQEDFRVFEDGREQEVTHFSNDRVPVSLGIALDTSASMEGEKIAAARAALNRFLYDLLDPTDEVFLYRFDSHPDLVEPWTTNRDRVRNELMRILPHGGTALYDAVAEAVPMTETGKHRKKALVVISDGNDTSSRTDLPELKQQIRQAEAIVYAIGIDGQYDLPYGRQQPPPRAPIPLPFPFPGGRRVPSGPSGGGSYPTRGVSRGSERVNVAALRDITDDSGGRTEIVREPRDLDPATARIADELSKQYYLGYTSNTERDGQWHSIRVDVKDRRLTVRARRGYVAS